MPSKKDIPAKVIAVIYAIQEASSLDSNDRELSALRTVSSELYWRCSVLQAVAPTSDEAVERVVRESELDEIERGLVDAFIRAEKRRLQRVKVPIQRRKVQLAKTEIASAGGNFSSLYDHLTRIRALFDGDADDDALWLCRFGYWSEWGEPLLRALRTLHILVNPLEVIFYS